MMEVNSRSTQEVLENEGVVDGTDNLKEIRLVKEGKLGELVTILN